MTGRNDPCPCGSAKKYKKCCLPLGGSIVRFTEEDRFSSFAKLRCLADTVLDEERQDAIGDFYGRMRGRIAELGKDTAETSAAVFDVWFFLDHELPEGGRVVDRLLAEEGLSPGERGYLELVRATAMRLYEVENTVPGVSVTFRDVIVGSSVTVHERLGSRSMNRHDLIAARIIPRGSSMQPEIEPGLLPIPPMIREAVIEQLRDHLEDSRSDDPESSDLDLWKDLGPFFNEAWMKCLVDPPIPKMANTDGEEMISHRVRFTVLDGEAVTRSLDSVKELERDGESTSWCWSGPNREGKIVTLGTLKVEEMTLLLECNSVQRADRGRAHVETWAPGFVTHLATETEDVRALIIEQLRAHARGEVGEPEMADPIPRDVQEALVLDWQAQHYRGWVDEPVPALDDHTPRQAAQDRGLRSRLIDLLKGLEGAYQRDLKDDRPAYDPSWMWADLGLEQGSAPDHPPPLAHERLATLVPGAAELCRAIAEETRKRADFEDGSTTLSPDEFLARQDVRSFLANQRLRASLGQPSAGSQDPRPAVLEDLLHTVTNHELHRRKAFWVDEALVYMLAKTDAQIPGSDLRAPFPSFAFVFTDRHVLSLGERLVARDHSSPLAGQFLRVAMAFVTESGADPDRRLRIVFAFDNLALDLPHLEVSEFPLVPTVSVQELLDACSAELTVNELSPTSTPLGALLQIVFNAILYATSPSVQPQNRLPPSRSHQPSRALPAERPFSSDSVYFLPGTIEISRVRKMQELERVSTGRTLLHRFLVRGHWRHAPRDWRDQRMRWVQPYWKGPSMAVTIEKAYRLKP